MKNSFCIVLGSVCAVASAFLGGFDNIVIALATLMCTDLLTGVFLALLFHKSPKTEGGLVSSKVFLLGAFRKIYMLILCGMGHQLDTVLGTAFLRDGIVYAFMANEILSIVENAGLMGIPIPKVLESGLEILNGKSDKA